MTELVQDHGWLIDPSRRHQIRYWDGPRWTERVSDNGRRSDDQLTEQPARPVHTLLGSAAVRASGA